MQLEIRDCGYDLLIVMVFGKRKRGRAKTKFQDSIKNIAGIRLARVVREAENRENWRRFSRAA